jgi:AraC family transcriptional regulator, transcriptional activator of pobA
VKGKALYQDDHLPSRRPPSWKSIRPKQVPIRPIADYGTVRSPVDEVFVARFERAIVLHPDRLRFHRHTYYELFWMNGGGGVCIDFQDYLITKPTMVFISPGQIHRWVQKPCLTGPFISFTKEFYDGRESPPSSLMEHEFWFPLHIAPLLVIPDENISAFKFLWDQIELEIESSREKNEILRALLRVIFNKASRLYQRQPPGRPITAQEAPAARIVREFRLAVEIHFRKTSVVADYARLLRVTPDHLASRVRALTGQSPSEIIRERMVLEAKRLLLFTSLTVSEIAYELKFKDAAYFSRFFRRLMCKTPGEFRREISEKYQV